MSSLRPLAVTVIESEQGTFRWRLVELLPDGQWLTVDQQARAVMGYAAAMAAGLLKLQGMIEDLEAGPREKEQKQKVSKFQGSGSLFGFGFGLPKFGQR